MALTQTAPETAALRASEAAVAEVRPVPPPPPGPLRAEPVPGACIRLTGAPGPPHGRRCNLRTLRCRSLSLGELLGDTFADFGPICGLAYSTAC